VESFCFSMFSGLRGKGCEIYHIHITLTLVIMVPGIRAFPLEIISIVLFSLICFSLSKN
jgi:hypothetical protein